MFPIAKAILKGALARDECRGAHFKPDFAMAGLTSEDPAERRREAEQWCEDFDEKNRKWLKSTIATVDASGEPTLSYEEVDTSLIPPTSTPLRHGRRGDDRRGLEGTARRPRRPSQPSPAPHDTVIEGARDGRRP